MFNQIKNLDTVFKHLRLFTIVIIFCSFSISCFSIFKAIQLIHENQQKIYIIADGRALQALSSNKKDNIEVEAIDLIKMFHHYFFTLTPDDKAITENISKSLYLADKSAKDVYDNLQEKGYYMQIVSANISQEILPDSVKVNMNSYPYYFRFYGKQRITRSTSIVTRELITEGFIRNLNERSENNPHGLLIEKWNTISNTDIEAQKR